MSKITDTKLLAALKKHNGNKTEAGKELGVTRHTVRRLCKKLEKKMNKTEIEQLCPLFYEGSGSLSEEELRYTWSVYESCNFNITRTSEALGVSTGCVQNRIKKARAVLEVVEGDHGYVRSRKPKSLPLPKEGSIRRYIFTSAQNNTHVHGPIWQSLLALAEHYQAEIKISTFTYVRNQQGSEKRGFKKQIEEVWYDNQIEPYVSDGYEKIAEGLVWCGNLNIIPTAKNPLSGLETYTGPDSGIFPHTKIQMQSVPTHKTDPAKFNYTTGSVTKRNYIQKKAGIVAEFHHSYGALLVEVNDKGQWFARQLNADTDGVIHDLNVKAMPTGEVVESEVEAVVWGDIHVACLDKTVKKIAWQDQDCMLDTLKPRYQFMHDILDFESRSHHNRRNPHEMYRIHVQGKGSVLQEVKEVGQFLVDSARPFCQTYVVNSNHDNHLNQWLREVNWYDDMLNAEFYIEAQREMLRQIREQDYKNMLEWSISEAAHLDVPAIFLRQDQSMVICEDNSGGIEMGMHGDMGPNGSRGSFRSLSKMGRRACIGHSHSAGIYEGIYVSGVSGELDMGYNAGPGSWSHSHTVVYPNGKRTIVTMKHGKWRA